MTIQECAALNVGCMQSELVEVIIQMALSWCFT